jgi:SAM-dependent methyltransferase
VRNRSSGATIKDMQTNAGNHADEPDADRIERERQWHDKRFAEAPERGVAVQSFGDALTNEAMNRTFERVRSLCPGREVLDYGCSYGNASLRMREFGATRVHGIDISPVAVNQAREAAAKAGVDRVDFDVMNAEVLEFPDQSFDLVFGVAILHHLDIDRACGEIARVLRPGGVALFVEPMGHNPGINLVRNATPGSRTEDEHPLLMSDFDLFRRHFTGLDTEYINLLTLATAPLVKVPGRELLRRGLNAVDKVVLKCVPFLGRYAWTVLLTMSGPRPRSAANGPR